MRERFSFALLGPVRAWRDGSELDLGSPQQRAVLAVLLLRAGTHVSAVDLVDTLWAYDPPKTAVATIRSYIYRLRKQLGGELITSTRNAYVFARPGDALDAVRFRKSLDQAQRARADGKVASAVRHMDDALGLWHGTPLAGVPGRFAEAQRALLSELRLTAMESRTEDNLALGNHTPVIAELPVLVDEHPYRERLRTLLMLALYRAGRQAEALAVFDEARHLFSAELGIGPGPEMRDLHLRILNGDANLMGKPLLGPGDDTPAPRQADIPRRGDSTVALERVLQVPPAQLPADLLTFAGRRGEVEFLVAEHEEPATASVTVITGMAGVGKTTLAVHAAHLLADRFPDGQLYIDLRGFDISGMVLSSQNAIRQLLAGLGVAPERVPADENAQTGLYRSLLAGRRALVVLDNALNAQQVRPLLPGTKGCVTLVTSRDQLRSLIAIEGARPLLLRPLSRDDARESLVRRLGADRVAAEDASTRR